MSTNQSDRFTRSKLRAELIEQLSAALGERVHIYASFPNVDPHAPLLWFAFGPASESAYQFGVDLQGVVYRWEGRAGLERDGKVWSVVTPEDDSIPPDIRERGALLLHAYLLLS